MWGLNSALGIKNTPFVILAVDGLRTYAITRLPRKVTGLDLSYFTTGSCMYILYFEQDLETSGYVYLTIGPLPSLSRLEECICMMHSN